MPLDGAQNFQEYAFLREERFVYRVDKSVSIAVVELKPPLEGP
jgi:hypothetical protein